MLTSFYGDTIQVGLPVLERAIRSTGATCWWRSVALGVLSPKVQPVHLAPLDDVSRHVSLKHYDRACTDVLGRAQVAGIMSPSKRHCGYCAKHGRTKSVG